jgi:hypothetical protein
LYRGGQVYWWMKPGDPEKTTDLSQVTDKLYHNVVHFALIGGCSPDPPVSSTTYPEIDGTFLINIHHI